MYRRAKVISVFICLTVSQSIAYSPHCSSLDLPLTMSLVSEQCSSLLDTRWPRYLLTLTRRSKTGIAGMRFRDTRHEKERYLSLSEGAHLSPLSLGNNISIMGELLLQI